MTKLFWTLRSKSHLGTAVFRVLSFLNNSAKSDIYSCSRCKISKIVSVSHTRFSLIWLFCQKYFREILDKSLLFDDEMAATFQTFNISQFFWFSESESLSDYPTSFARHSWSKVSKWLLFRADNPSTFPTISKLILFRKWASNTFLGKTSKKVEKIRKNILT